MSTRIMAACWPLQIDPTAKAVLISLADNANDDGFCWPSIATICERTCYSKDAVIRSIKRLEETGLVNANRGNGRHTTYTITPENYQQPVAQNDRSFSATGSAERPEPVAQKDQPVAQKDTNRKEPSITVSGTVNISDPKFDPKKYLLDLGVIDSIATDWLQHRKLKKALPTKTAIDSIAREAVKAGMSLSDALSESCQRAWIGFKAEWMDGKPTGYARESQEERRERTNREAKALLGITGSEEKTIECEVLHA